MARTVITPDGVIYGNVPDSFTDEQVFQKHLESIMKFTKKLLKF